jgi:hypothetical protein
MKIIGSVILALLIGLVLGGWGPRRDLKEAQREMEELKTQAKKGGNRNAGLDGIASLLQVPDQADRSARRAIRSGEISTHPAGTNATSGAERPSRPMGGGGTNGPARVDFRERIKAAAELWKVRRDLARNGFMSQVKPTPAEAAQVDVIMQAMNVRLQEGVVRWVDYIKEAEALSPEDGIRMMNELSGIVVTTYDDLDRALPEDWRDKAGEKFQVFDFIDPEVALPLADVAGIMERPGGGGFRRPPSPPP